MATRVELPDVDDDDVLANIYGDRDHEGSEDGENRPISLPSGSDSDALPVDLPDADLPCCSMDCSATIQQDKALKARLSELDAGLNTATDRHEKAKLQYDCMKAWQTLDSGWRRFSVFGTEPCCQTALQRVLGMSHKVYLKFCDNLKQGFIDPPVDMRLTQNQRSTGKAAHEQVAAANALLTWVHENMAEHLAESDKFLLAKKSIAARGTGSSAALMDAAQGPREVKWLPPGTTLSEIRDFSSSFNSEIRPPSFATFSRVYHSEWQPFLKIRTERQHSKCNDCQKLKAWRRQCQSKADVDKVQRQLELHIKSMKEDRKVDAAINAFAQQTARGDLTDPTKTCLSIVIDGMDENKFRIPKRIDAAKQLAQLWRPECRFVGCLAEGLTENFFIGDCTLVKDCNLDLTIISHVIHEAQRILQERSVALPSVLRLHSDNASSELKKPGGNEVLRVGLPQTNLPGNPFDTIPGGAFPWEDQRFSECRSVLANSANMETPAQFLKALEKVKARESRTLNLEQIHATVDFTEFFSELPAVVSGHTQTAGKSQRGQEAIHVFIFQLRKNLPSTSAKVEETFPGCKPHPQDVILSCKHYLSSPSDSQPPQVFLPHDCLQVFDPSGQGPRQLCGRRALTERQMKEFTKTAEVVSQPPWNMHDASAYLLRLMASSQDPDGTDQPPSMHWTLRGTKEDHAPALDKTEKTDAIRDEDVAFAVRQPAQVCVVPKQKRTAAKTPPKKKPKRKSEDEGDHISLPSPGLEEEFQPAAEPRPATVSSAALGAPPRTAVEAPVPKAAGAKPTAKSKAKAKAKANGQAKGTAKAKAGNKKKCPGWLPLPEGAREKIAELNHSKCRKKGCPDCRRKIGLVLNDDHTAWTWDPSRVS
jgi:hypothetical protein